LLKQLLALFSVGSHAWSPKRLSISLFSKNMVSIVFVSLPVVLDAVSSVSLSYAVTWPFWHNIEWLWLSEILFFAKWLSEVLILATCTKIFIRTRDWCGVYFILFLQYFW
jgi:hypothetical protein